MLSKGERHYLRTGEKLEGGEPTQVHRSSIQRRIRDKLLRLARDLREIEDSPHFYPEDEMREIEHALATGRVEIDLGDDGDA